jgi:NADH dehydrogenase FAD-containing subunit
MNTSVAIAGAGFTGMEASRGTESSKWCSRNTNEKS